MNSTLALLQSDCLFPEDAKRLWYMGTICAPASTITISGRNSNKNVFLLRAGGGNEDL